MSKPWNVPTWLTDEDRRRYEGMVDSLHHVVQWVREGAGHVNPAQARDVETWLFWVGQITREADEWAERMERVFGKPSDLRAPTETPSVEPEEGP